MTIAYYTNYNMPGKNCIGVDRFPVSTHYVRGKTQADEGKDAVCSLRHHSKIRRSGVGGVSRQQPTPYRISSH